MTFSERQQNEWQDYMTTENPPEQSSSFIMNLDCKTSREETEKCFREVGCSFSPVSLDKSLVWRNLSKQKSREELITTKLDWTVTILISDFQTHSSKSSPLHLFDQNTVKTVILWNIIIIIINNYFIFEYILKCDSKAEFSAQETFLLIIKIC